MKASQYKMSGSFKFRVNLFGVCSMCPKYHKGAVGALVLYCNLFISMYLLIVVNLSMNVFCIFHSMLLFPIACNNVLPIY